MSGSNMCPAFEIRRFWAIFFPKKGTNLSKNRILMKLIMKNGNKVRAEKEEQGHSTVKREGSGLEEAGRWR